MERGAFTLDRIRILVLDEADRMLDMGFRPAIDRIVAACSSERQTMFFSATLEGIAGDLAGRYTTKARTHEHGTPGRYDPARVEHRFVPVRDGDRLEALVKELEGERDRAIVFVRTKRGADRLVKRLDARGVKAVAIHGDKSQGQRNRALSHFQSGHVDTLVATDLAARGIDVDGVSHVVNFDPPADNHAYIHRIGRTGRAGGSGVGVTLVGQGEREEMRQLARRLGLRHGLGGAEDRHGPRAPSTRRRRPRSVQGDDARRARPQPVKHSAARRAVPVRASATRASAQVATSLGYSACSLRSASSASPIAQPSRSMSCAALCSLSRCIG